MYPSRINRWQDTAAACDPFPNERNLHLSSYYTLEPFSFQGQTNTITTFLLLIDVSILRDHRRERVQGLRITPRLEPTRWVLLSAEPLERTKALRLSLDPCGARWYRTPDLIVFPPNGGGTHSSAKRLDSRDRCFEFPEVNAASACSFVAAPKRGLRTSNQD